MTLATSQAVPLVFLTKWAVFLDEILDVTGPESLSERRAKLSDSQWLRRRLEIFTRVTVPSLRNQNTADFEWIIGISTLVPTALVKLVQESVGRLAQILIIPERSTFSAALHSEEFDSWSGKITVRLDSDDAVSSDFVEMTKRRARLGELLNFHHVAHFRLDDEVFSLSTSRSNQFLSFWSDDGRTVFDLGPHRSTDPLVRIQEVTTLLPMVLIGAHKDGRTSHLPGWPVFKVNKISRRFGQQLSHEGSVKRLYSTGSVFAEKLVEQSAILLELKYKLRV